METIPQAYNRKEIKFFFCCLHANTQLIKRKRKWVTHINGEVFPLNGCSDALIILSVTTQCWKCTSNYFHGSCKFYRAGKEMTLVPPSHLPRYLAFATVESEPLTSAQAVQQGDSVLRLRKGGTEPIRSRCWEVLQCLSEESLVCSNKRMKGVVALHPIISWNERRIFHMFHTHTFHSLFLHYILRYIICSHRELSWPQKSFYFMPVIFH